MQASAGTSLISGTLFREELAPRLLGLPRDARRPGLPEPHARNGNAPMSRPQALPRRHPFGSNSRTSTRNAPPLNLGLKRCSARGPNRAQARRRRCRADESCAGKDRDLSPALCRSPRRLRTAMGERKRRPLGLRAGLFKRMGCWSLRKAENQVRSVPELSLHSGNGRRNQTSPARAVRFERSSYRLRHGRLPIITG